MLRSSLFVTAATALCFACTPVPPIEGEGDRPSEGEGEEGEGDDIFTPGEGEGDGVVGEGEGDVVVGEGEGDVVVGEGEGDVVVGEGEGDIVAGEGEGEGEVVVVGAGIFDLRAAAVGPVNVAVSDVAVTYVRPGFDANNNQAGFYVQQAAGGPAIFVRDAAGSAAVSAGDVVDFTATSTVASEGRLEVATFTNLVVVGRTNVANLRQDFTNDAGLVSGIADRESEFSRTTVTLLADVVTNAGAGFVKGAAATNAIIAAPTGITVRLAPTVATAAGLRTGCSVVVESPLGHTKFAADEAQLTAWELSQLQTVSGCPASITSAVVLDATHVVLTFNRALDPATVSSATFQTFISDPDSPLGLFDATVDGNVVTLVTDVQEAGTDYTVEADAAAVHDIFGNALDDLGRFVHFDGFNGAGLGLLINEVDYDNVGADNDEWVEVINLGSAAVDLSTVEAIFVDGLSATAGVRVVGSGVVAGNGGIGLIQFAPGGLENGPDGVVLWDSVNHVAKDVVSYEVPAITGVVIDGVTVDLNGPGLEETGAGSICRDPLTRAFEVCATTTKNAAN